MPWATLWGHLGGDVDDKEKGGDEGRREGRIEEEELERMRGAS